MFHLKFSIMANNNASRVKVENLRYQKSDGTIAVARNHQVFQNVECRIWSDQKEKMLGKQPACVREFPLPDSSFDLRKTYDVLSDLFGDPCYVELKVATVYE